MAFEPLFADSFDHYDTSTFAQKWNIGAGAGIQNSNARTGTNCAALSAAGGMSTKGLGQQSNLIIGHALNPERLVGSIFFTYSVATGDNQTWFTLDNQDGSISVNVGNPPFYGNIGNTPSGLVRTNTYNYIEYAIIFAPGSGGSVFVRINGQLVLSLIGVTTSHSGLNWADAVGPSGPPSNFDVVNLHDDIYIGRSTTPDTIQNDFRGAVRIYPRIPIANKTPQLWTPLAPPAFSEINQIPPPGDAAYISDGTPGDSSLFQLDFISGEGPVGAYSIEFGQTVMSAKLDSAGSRLIAPNIGGNVGDSVALTSNYQMYTQPYLLNPVTGLPFAPSDFTTTFLGPQVTG